VIDGTGIPTAAVFQLFNAGDSIAETAEEYDRTPNEIDIAGRLLIQAMRGAGAKVVALFEEFKPRHARSGLLPVVTSRGWILITKDDKWRYRHEEMMILIRAKARAFGFVSKTAKREEIGETIVRVIPRRWKR
jgi:PIN like domain